MALLGIDVGTSGCKSAVFSETGELLTVAYEEYDMERPQSGWAQLNTVEVWDKVQATIRSALSEYNAAGRAGPVTALAVQSMGEAVVPVTRDRRIVGPSILNFERARRTLPARARRSWVAGPRCARPVSQAPPPRPIDCTASAVLPRCTHSARCKKSWLGPCPIPPPR